MVTKTVDNEKLERLRQMLKPGDTVYTDVVHVSRSGMYRVIRMYVIRDNRPQCIDNLAADLLEGYDSNHEGCQAHGVGMDMGFHLVYNLGYALFPEGFTCTGEGCPANDHLNKPYPERDGQMHHRDGGYALRQEWL